MPVTHMSNEQNLDPKTEAFFRDIAESGALPDGVSAATATKTVLCHLLQRVSGGEARDFVRAAPPTLRTLLTPCVATHAEKPSTFDCATFLDRVAGELHVPRDTAARMSRAVFAAVQRHLSRKEDDDVEAQLPKDLRELWRHPERPATL